MKRYEILEKYFYELSAKIEELHNYIIDCDGGFGYHVYVWEDGEIECLEYVPGGHCYLQAKDSETRKLYYVADVVENRFDWEDFVCGTVPNPALYPDAWECLRSETIKWLKDEFCADSIIEDAIDEAYTVEAA